MRFFVNLVQTINGLLGGFMLQGDFNSQIYLDENPNDLALDFLSLSELLLDSSPDFMTDLTPPLAPTTQPTSVLPLTQVTEDDLKRKANLADSEENHAKRVKIDPELKKELRRTKNKSSASKSRANKQSKRDQLETEVNALEVQNHMLSEKVQFLVGYQQALKESLSSTWAIINNNETLKEQYYKFSMSSKR